MEKFVLKMSKIQSKTELKWLFFEKGKECFRRKMQPLMKLYYKGSVNIVYNKKFFILFCNYILFKIYELVKFCVNANFGTDWAYIKLFEISLKISYFV